MRPRRPGRLGPKRPRRFCRRPPFEALEARLALTTVIGVNAAANIHPINPDIYGAAFATTAQISDLNLTVNREGGENADTYNWQADSENHAIDWYFESIADGSGNGQSKDAFVSQTKAGGAQPDLTIPILPYVASLGPNGSDLGSYPVSVYGLQQYADPYNSNFGNGVTSGGQNITDTNPLYNYVANSPTFEKSWIQHLIATSGTAANGGVQLFTLGNEPGIWNSTHRDIHPAGETNTELLNDIISYGSMIKSIDPGAQILGPEEWGWTNYFVDGADSTAGNYNATYNGLNVEQWLLKQLDQYQQQHGTRLLDYFTLHYYPQEGVDNSNVDQGTDLLRNQSTRALWDPNYVDPSWINSKIDLIPRMQSWVNTYYPGTKTGITEYNFGAEGNMNGATTQADVYGIFGQQGLDLATRWTTPAAGTPTYLAMKLWRNYDGHDSGFGNLSVGTTVPNPDQTDAFAATRSSDGALTVAVINKSLYDPSQPTATTSVTINLSGFASDGVAQDWQLAAVNPSDQTKAAITQLSNIHFSGNSITINVPMESVTMLVIEPATPVLTISNPSVTYNTGGPPIVLAATATLGSDSNGFANSSLSVANMDGGAWDRLGVQTSAGLTVSGTTISYNGMAVGTFTGGAASNPLVVTFNARATEAAVLAVVQHVTFKNLILNPGSLGNREATFQLTDGAGNHGAIATQTVVLATPPVLVIGGGAVTYKPGGSPIAIAPAATLSSGDWAFAGSSLSVADTTFSTQTSDRLGIRSSGSLAVSGASLVYGGVTVGTVSGGNAGTLSITFNSQATEAAVLAVVHNVTFTNVNPAPATANRLIRFQLTDGLGNLGAPATQTVEVS